MKNSIFDLRSSSLSRSQMKSISGGEYNCRCNGKEIGSASTPEGCAGLCSDCVDSGRCPEELEREFA